MELIINMTHDLFQFVYGIYSKYCDFMLNKYPYADLILTFATALNAAIAVYASQVNGKKKYWAHSLFLVLLGGFAGGIMVSMVLGLPIAPIANDAVIPITFITWYLLHNLGAYHFLSLTPVTVVWTLFLSNFRTHAIIGAVNRALTVVKPGPFYPIPLFGPIVTGIVGGSAGAFLPWDKGLSAITKCLPWPIQSAILTSVFYHLMVNDQVGFCGTAMRSIFGDHTEADVKVFLLTANAIQYLAMVIFSPDANIFHPFHKVLYFVFQVQGPSPSDNTKDEVGWDFYTRVMLERMLEMGRVIVVIAVVAGHIYMIHPPTTIYYGKKLHMGKSIGTCTLFHDLRNCKPFEMKLEKDQLIVIDKKDPEKPLWARKFTPPTDESAKVFSELTSKGVLRIVAKLPEKPEQQLWASKVSCKTEGTEGTLKVELDPISGVPHVHCPDGTPIPITP